MGSDSLLSAEFDAFADDLLRERDARPLIIVGTSKAESLLFELLRIHLLPKIAKPKDQDELLEGDRPLGTFSARIKACYRLGLIDATLCRMLEKLRELRNASAHSVKFDVSKSPAREHLFELRKALSTRDSFQLTRERYFGTSSLSLNDEIQCFLLTLCLLLEAIRAQTRTIRSNPRTLRIAAK